jgi:hypothetical protein
MVEVAAETEDSTRRHCERSEAIHFFRPAVIASEAKQSIDSDPRSLRAKRSNPFTFREV